MDDIERYRLCRSVSIGTSCRYCGYKPIEPMAVEYNPLGKGKVYVVCPSCKAKYTIKKWLDEID